MCRITSMGPPPPRAPLGSRAPQAGGKVTGIPPVLPHHPIQHVPALAAGLNRQRPPSRIPGVPTPVQPLQHAQLPKSFPQPSAAAAGKPPRSPLAARKPPRSPIAAILANAAAAGASEPRNSAFAHYLPGESFLQSGQVLTNYSRLLTSCCRRTCGQRGAMMLCCF